MENQSIIDLGNKENVKDMIKGFFSRYHKTLRDTAAVQNKEDITNRFSCMILGPRSVIPGEGIEPYVTSKDMVMFLYALYAYMQKNNMLTGEDEIREIYPIIEDITSDIEDTTGLYDALINAIDVYKIGNDTSTMLNVLSKVGASTASHADMALFTDLVNIPSIGVLLNHGLSKKCRTEIIYSEIRNGIQSWVKPRGIPSEEIVDFFLNAKDSLITRAFDVSMLAINLYIMLYSVRDLDGYIEAQTKNIEYKYMIQGKIENESEEESKKKAYSETCNSLKEHYVNVEKILKRLIFLLDAEGNLAIDAHTCGYILVHVPPASYFARSSYGAMYESYSLRCKVGKVKKEYNDIVKAIVYLCPNINIAPALYDMIGLNAYEDIESIIGGIRLGFARYALYTMNEIGNIIEGKYGTQYKNDEENNEKILKATEYLRMNYIEKIRYLVEDIPSFVSSTAAQVQDEVEDSPESTVANSNVYKENNLALVLETTNAYIQVLTSLNEEKKIDHITMPDIGGLKS
jgi:hypothetical protein